MGFLENASSALSQLLETHGLLAVFVVMLAKEIGVPVPIPSDLIMLAAAAQAAAGRYEVWVAFGLILAAMVVGASLQFVLARGYGRSFLYRFGRYVGLSYERLDAVASSVRRGGATAVALSLLTPGVRAATVPASGLAGMPYTTFLPGLVLGSGGFLALHFAIGFAAGALLDTVLGTVGLPVLVALVLLAAVGLVAWTILRRRTAAGALETARDWADATCPVCLGIAAVSNLGQGDASHPTVPGH